MRLKQIPSVLFGLVLVCSAGETVGGTPEQIGDATAVTHIGVVVHDIERSAQAYAALVGIDTPPISLADLGHGAGPVRTAYLRLSNISIELIQPAENRGDPLRDFLDTHGQGVHHLELRREGADPGEGHDLTDEVGVVIEYTESAGGRPAPVTRPGLELPTCVTHLGIAVPDIARSRYALANAIGVEPSPIREFEEARGLAAYTVFNLGNVSIELLQQTGDGSGTYADFLLEQLERGPRPHHLGLHLRRQGKSLSMPEQIAWLEQHDGQIAADAGGFAYLDFRPQLGVFVEALPPASNERVYPHPHTTP